MNRKAKNSRGRSSMPHEISTPVNITTPVSSTSGRFMPSTADVVGDAQLRDPGDLLDHLVAAGGHVVRDVGHQRQPQVDRGRRQRRHANRRLALSREEQDQHPGGDRGEDNDAQDGKGHDSTLLEAIGYQLSAFSGQLHLPAVLDARLKSSGLRSVVLTQTLPQTGQHPLHFDHSCRQLVVQTCAQVAKVPGQQKVVLKLAG